MKKVIMVLVIVLLAAGTVFAQSYSVQEVSGRVQREAGNSRVDIKIGDTLTVDTLIRINVGARLVLRDGEQTHNVPARNGKVGDLISQEPGFKINGNVTRVEVGAVSRANAQVATASARASEAADDYDIATE